MLMHINRASNLASDRFAETIHSSQSSTCRENIALRLIGIDRSRRGVSASGLSRAARGAIDLTGGKAGVGRRELHVNGCQFGGLTGAAERRLAVELLSRRRKLEAALPVVCPITIRIPLVSGTNQPIT
jgi:hypothetical protein